MIDDETGFREAPASPEPDRSILVVVQHGNVLGLDRATGEIRWRAELKRGWGEAYYGEELAVGYGAVVVSPLAAELCCLSYTTGKLRWVKRTQLDGVAKIVIEPDQIVCTKGGYVECFAPDGRSLWVRELDVGGPSVTTLGYPGNVVK
jgi:outer membrane protein assembly factor BamB